jgi:hypothetical protein
MNLGASKAKTSVGGSQRQCAGFTLAEVLAALVFMAIVIPVTVQGVRVANLAGQVGARKAIAIRVAERVLNEHLVTGQLQATAQGGTIQEGVYEFQWNVRVEPWTVDVTLNLATVEVTYQVQGQEYKVDLSTLNMGETQL